jgi:hypothetical protein
MNEEFNNMSLSVILSTSRDNLIPNGGTTSFRVYKNTQDLESGAVNGATHAPWTYRQL